MQQLLHDWQASIFAYVVAFASVLVVFGLRARRRRDSRVHDLVGVPYRPGERDPSGLEVLDVLLRGFGITIPRDELRKHLKIEASGAISIDDIEDAANHFGLIAEQRVTSPASVLDPVIQLLPCIALIAEVKVFPEYYILWRREGGRVQVFDSSDRVRWMDADHLQSMFYIHEMEFDGQPISGAVVIRVSGLRPSNQRDSH